mgnify:CR=1 FL=1
MLFTLHFRTNQLTLPLGYHVKIQGLIYNLTRSLPDYGTFLHDAGYGETSRRFKLFCFSDLTGPHQLRGRQIIFPHHVSLQLRTADPQMGALLEQVRPTIIRCNQEEAAALLGVRQKQDLRLVSGGVESGLTASEEAACALATQLAQKVGCTVLMTGATDVVTDGVQLATLHGGDPCIQRITGGGCMLSALCALLCGGGVTAFDAARLAGQLWRDCAAQAGQRAGTGRMGTFHVALFDAVSAVFWNEGAVEG